MTDLTSNPSDAGAARQPARVAVVVPAWLNEALLILLQSEASIQLLASASTVAELESQSPEPDPELILIDGKRELEGAYDQVSRVKIRWPDAVCIILVDHIRQQKVLKAAGADQILVKGVSPQKLLATIRDAAVRRAEKS